MYSTSTFTAKFDFHCFEVLWDLKQGMSCCEKRRKWGREEEEEIWD